MVIRMVVRCLVPALLTASIAFAADIFKDDFSSCPQTSLNWSNIGDSLTANCALGKYSLVNNDRNYAGLVYTQLANPKPTTFTVSGKITRTPDSTPAGFYVCLKLDTGLTGYAFQLNQVPWITAYKYVKSTPKLLISQPSNWVVAGTNELKVSKCGTSFYIFCNGHFVTSFTDATNPIASGDFGVVVPTKASVIIDDILMTDLCTTGERPVRFSDDFNDNTINGWADFKTTNAGVQEINNSFLSINTTAANAYDYHYVQGSFSTFVSRIIVQNRGGDAKTAYGIFLANDTANGDVRKVHFAIDGDREFNAGDTVKLSALHKNLKIRGAPYISGPDTIYWWDTIDVTRRSNSSYYKLTVNGEMVDSLATSQVNFPITALGIFMSQGATIYVDNFFVGPDWESILNPGRHVLTLKTTKFNPATGPLFDPLGRVVRGIGPYGGAGQRIKAPGVYLTKEGKKGVVLK